MIWYASMKVYYKGKWKWEFGVRSGDGIVLKFLGGYYMGKNIISIPYNTTLES